MREQRHESGRILICQRSLKLQWGCIKDMCCYLYFSEVVVDVTEFAREAVLCELLHADDMLTI